MQPTAIWIIYTLMFGYPVPTRDEHEFTNQAACENSQAFIRRASDQQFPAGLLEKISADCG